MANLDLLDKVDALKGAADVIDNIAAAIIAGTVSQEQSAAALEYTAETLRAQIDAISNLITAKEGI